ncbi:DNA polymerase III subunit gamma and tau [uncultured Amnibacterium sp.]|uniref:DNA polymerase III subunit gamma and tau n=1 Tax=uncultured Amnibacterium sp. TaxID=1631851 RepID=UPI0035CC35BB
MVTALYRRYRPETFAELIGQSHVTDPLRTALRADRVNHAYLFSGPRGCGKTTSARILARCLNCAEGPTDTPCGVCASCVELGRGGPGSLDVIEIDAASHNGVDDARDLRDRAVFAPARDRYKIFILDEAHMVTSQGFNALLKIVEEPPEHVKFVFATTEPEKVIGTIRSRTHHYPFRLVPPAQMLAYIGELCVTEGVDVEAGVLPLAVRAGGGSVRDTLSLLDQLIAGSDDRRVSYDRATSLLGYTSSALIDEVVDAVGDRDAAGAFAAVDRIVQTGQDPRRFVEDLLERLRDLILVAATGEQAGAVLRGVPADTISSLVVQSTRFGPAELSLAADTVSAALDEMVGATSPRLQLELMLARMLVPAADTGQRGAIARLERLERRVGVESPAAPVTERPVSAEQGAPLDRPVTPPSIARSTPPAATSVPPASEIRTSVPSGDRDDRGASDPQQPSRPAAVPWRSAPAAASAAVADPGSVEQIASPATVASASGTVGVTLQHVRDAWPQILETVQRSKRSAWAVVFTSHPRALDGDVLTISFVSRGDVETFRQTAPTGGVSEVLRSAILEVLGVRVKFRPRVDGGEPASTPEQPEAPTAPTTQAVPVAASERYGESVVREILGASFLEETAVVPAREG